jgi:hypothetical protein
MKLHLNLDKMNSFKPETRVEEWNLTTQISKKEQNGLDIITGHLGKRMVFESYLKTNEEMAMKYLKFISDNPCARYVKWDVRRQRFVPAT